jgi:hypothetical protein
VGSKAVENGSWFHKQQLINKEVSIKTEYYADVGERFRRESAIVECDRSE